MRAVPPQPAAAGKRAALALRPLDATRLEQAFAAWPEVATMRIGGVETNAGAQAFWRKLGYRETGGLKRNFHFVADIVVLEKPLSR